MIEVKREIMQKAYGDFPCGVIKGARNHGRETGSPLYMILYVLYVWSLAHV